MVVRSSLRRACPFSRSRWASAAADIGRDRYAIDITADGLDGSGGLKPEDRGLWEREDAVEVAPADLQVRGADARDTNLDPDLPLGRSLHGNVLPPENVRGPKLG